MRAWPKGQFWPVDVARQAVGQEEPLEEVEIAGWDLYRVRTALVYYVLNDMKGGKSENDMNVGAIDRMRRLVERLDEAIEG